MDRRMKVLIYFAIILGVSIICCFCQVSEHDASKIRIKNPGESSQLEEPLYSGEPLNAESADVDAAVYNPCLDAEFDAEKKNESVLARPRRVGQHNFNSADGHRTSEEHFANIHKPEELRSSNHTSHRFSDHFLNCNHIGMEPDETQLLSNGSVHVPRVYRTFDKSEFCQSGNGVVFICDEWLNSNGKNTTGHAGEYGDYSYLSDEFLNCSGHIEIDKGSFESRSNGSVYVPLYNRVFDYSNHLIGSEGQLFICPTFFPKEEKFSEVFEIVTIAGLSVSIIFIILYMVFFAFMESLRNLPGYCLFSLCLALLTAYICFFLRRMGPDIDQCRDLVLSIMYFFLVAFFWMNVLSFDVWRSLKMATSKLRLSSNSMMWKRFVFYSLYAWLSPLCIVVFGILVTKYGSSMVFLQLEFDPNLCWFTKKGALFVYLALPLVILMCLNVIFFTSSFIMISRASLNTSENMATFWKRFFLFLRLAVIMGVAWIFGIIAAATNQPALFYIFVILNTLQGVFIFCSFALSEKTKKVLKKKLNLRKSSVFPSQFTSQPIQSVTTI